MRFANTWEIDSARERWRRHPILGPATQTLANVRDAANQNSDGWAYWPKPARAASKLMELIFGNGTNQHFDTVADRVTVADLRRALVPLKAFRTRSRLPFEIVEASRDV